MRHTIMIAFETHYIVIGVSKFISAFHFLVTSIIGFLLLCERTLIDISFPFTITSIFTSKFPMDGWVRAPFHRLLALFSSTQHVHCTVCTRLTSGWFSLSPALKMDSILVHIVWNKFCPDSVTLWYRGENMIRCAFIRPFIHPKLKCIIDKHF